MTCCCPTTLPAALPHKEIKCWFVMYYDEKGVMIHENKKQT